MQKYYLAIDIGASSGRHIVGWREDGEIRTKEVYRFPSGVREEKGSLVWDVEALLREVKNGIRAAKAEYPDIRSLSIDTWGVDYVLLKGDQEVLSVYAYRDSRTEAVIPLVHEKMPFSELYRRTGCQFQSFNSIYQLYADKLAGRLEGVTNLLMIPEYLLWKLCGVKAREYTNATTMGLVSAQTGEFDEEMIEALGYPKHLFPKLSKPGTVIGVYEGIQCVLCATHDTGSAVEGIPMEGNEPYISSGTWSLLGVKTPRPITDRASENANYSNEGGVGYNRYQKNIMGMWLVNELKRDLCPDMAFPEIVQAAEESACDLLVDANAPEFLAPKSMKAAFDAAANGKLQTIGDYFRCAYGGEDEGIPPGGLGHAWYLWRRKDHGRDLWPDRDRGKGCPNLYAHCPLAPAQYHPGRSDERAGRLLWRALQERLPEFVTPSGEMIGAHPEVCCSGRKCYRTSMPMTSFQSRRSVQFHR